MFREKLEKRLKVQKDSGLYRDPLPVKSREGKYIFINNKKVLSFASNDYIGISQSEKFKKIVSEKFLKYGPSSSSSRLVSGNYSIINEAEKRYADYFGYHDALFFPSGYQANIGVLTALFKKNDSLLFDKHIHSSCVKGITMSGASFSGYKHNSMTHLEKKLLQNPSIPKAVVTESLFSMDGDILKIDEYKRLKEQYNFFSIIDEAHAFGAIGKKGRGAARSAADIGVGTFGKALGFYGAFVLLPQGLKEYLLNFSSPIIYSTALPEAHAAASIELLSIIEKADEERDKIDKLGKLLRNNLLNEGFSVSGDAHILMLEIKDEIKALKISQKMLDDGIFVLPVRYPTVPLNKAILRISITAMHDKTDINTLLGVIKKYPIKD